MFSVMENQIEKKVDNDLDTAVIYRFLGNIPTYFPISF